MGLRLGRAGLADPVEPIALAGAEDATITAGANCVRLDQRSPQIAHVHFVLRDLRRVERVVAAVTRGAISFTSSRSPIWKNSTQNVPTI